MTVPGGYLQMDVEAVEPVLHGLASTGADLDDAWSTGRSAIPAGEAAIGGDELGAAFRGIYAEDSAAVGANADRLPDTLRTDAEVGSSCVTDYVAADQRGAEALRGVAGGASVPGGAAAPAAPAAAVPGGR
ncbi:hypothetical protein [Plantactinospora sonchi]|uniref:Uncharacterized protein n=1 Tax=Plantactinospora sonchi TaxID=1544735 RepID=A0ABU7RP48_9ACTN